MTTGAGGQETMPDLEVVAGVVGRLPLAVVLLDEDGHPAWSNEVVQGLAGDSPDGIRRMLETVARAAGPVAGETEPRTVHARLPADRGLLERELWIGPAAGGFHLVTFSPEPTVPTGSAPTATHARRVEAMLARTLDLVTVLDDQGTIQLSNAAAGRLTGFSGGTANGEVAFSFVHPDDVERVAAAFADVLAAPGVHPTVDLRVRFADGTWHHIEATPDNLLGDPDVGGIVVTMHDVTEQKRAEAEAARSTSYLQSLIENLSDVIVVLDAGFDVLWTSPALSRIIDAPVETNLGMNALNDIHPDDAAAAFTALTEVAAAPLGSTVRVELRIEARPNSGDWRWIEATAVNRLADPHVQGLVCTLRDVTDAKAAAVELQLAYERERAAAERLRELDVLKDQFLASISHEMRTPVAIIIGFADLLGRDELEPDVRREAIDRVRSSAAEMRGMVENLLDFSALEAGKLSMVPRAVPLRRAVDATINSVRPLVRDHLVRVDVPDDLVALVDADGIDRILRNLLANAAKYSDPGRSITVTGRRDGDTAELAVGDEGVGIAADQLGLVFERLYRAPGAAFAGRGTGVGLNMVRRYAELMGGSVSVRSTLGEGSVFTVRLPIA